MNSIAEEIIRKIGENRPKGTRITEIKILGVPKEEIKEIEKGLKKEFGPGLNFIA